LSPGKRVLKAWRHGPSSQPGNVVLSIAIIALITCNSCVVKHLRSETTERM
jgi:hypothetical protein